MEWLITRALHFAEYLERDLGAIFAGMVIALAVFVGLYFLSSKVSSERSLRGLMNYLFPSVVVRQARIDLAVFILSKLSFTPLATKIVGFVAVEAAGTKVLAALFGERVLAIPNSWSVLLLQFLVPYLVGEFSFYWAHRALHQNSLLWSLHRVHHSAETLTFLTNERAHPVETLGLRLWYSLWAGSATAVLSYMTRTAMHPLLPLVLLFHSIIGSIIYSLQHSHVRTSFGPLDYILQSGEMHQIHHSAELRHRDRNFGSLLSVFDWMFGTMYIPQREETFRCGLSVEEIGENNPYKRLADIYTEPFAYARRVLRSRRPATAQSAEPVVEATPVIEA